MGQIYLYFFYGLAFFTMGLAVLTFVFGTHASLRIRALGWIGFFGLLHAANEWLAMFSFLERDVQVLRAEAIVREIVNAASYIALTIGAVRILERRIWRFAGAVTVLLWALSLATLWSIEAPAAEFDVVTRLLLGGPASFLTAVAFFRLDPDDVGSRQPHLKAAFCVAAGTFAAYGLFVLVAQPSDLFPANHINTLWFAEQTGIEVAWFRASAAGAIALTLLFVVRLVSEERIDDLQQREDRLLAVLDRSPLGVSIFSTDPFERHYVNRRFSELVGYRLGAEPDAVGQETFVDPEDYRRMSDELANGIERDNVVALRKRPDTGEHWWSAVSTRKIEFAGRDAALVWVMDISDLKEREAQTVRNALQLRSILESCSTGVCVFHRVSMTREYLYASNRMLEMFGATNLEELNAFGFLNTFADRNEAINMRDRHNAGDYRRHAVYERVRLDGSRFWAMGTATEIEFEGQPATIAWITDVTSSVEERRQIENNAEQLRRILESSRSGVTIFDESTHERFFATGRALEQFGYETLEDLNSARFERIFVREDDAVEAMRIIEQESGSRHYTLERRRPDGSTWWALVDIDEIEFEGKAAKIAWHHDVTQQKQIEADLRETVEMMHQMQEELVEAEKMASLGGLIAGVAHEINTPVGICLTAASSIEHEVGVLRMGYEKGALTRTRFLSILDKLAGAADIAARNAKRAGELISSFKQVAVDQSSDDKRKFLLLDYIEDVLISLGPELSRRRTVYALHGDRSIELTGYPGAISQIVTNLAMNAAIHAYGDGAGGTIEITCEESGDNNIVMSFRDFGIGMDEETARQVFNPFFTTRRGRGGTGLGMHVLYNLVTQRLGGRVTCRSTPGQGTTFELRFPRVAA